MTGTGSKTHSYSPRPVAWLLAGLLLACAAQASDPGDSSSEHETGPVPPPVDIVLVWVGDRQQPPGTPPEVAPEEPPAPALDLDSLEDRLRETRALGLFTKLELKHQVGDLVDDLEAFHRQRSDLNLAQLEERFDLLLFKLLLLLQEDDPELHRDIADARPALWATLSDPVQFAMVKGP